MGSDCANIAQNKRKMAILEFYGVGRPDIHFFLSVRIAAATNYAGKVGMGRDAVPIRFGTAEPPL